MNKNIFNLKILSACLFFIVAIGCRDTKKKFDASGTFEATEIIVSAESTGKILTLNIKEGDTVSKGKIVGHIDPLSIELQKEQVAASMTALTKKSNDASPQISIFKEQIDVQRHQIAVQKQQLIVLQKEQKRVENLVNAEAATPKQLDDINGQIDILKKQIEAAESSIRVFEKQISAQTSMVDIQNRGILSEKLPLEKRMAQLDEQMNRSNIMNPIDGIILSKYAESGEVTAVGKAIYKVANMSEMTLRAYMTGDQLGQIKINQKVKVLIDDGKNKYRELPGTISWVSDKAEFTPKTVQTKDERANLVYALKINIKNDGTLKIGMYGEVLFN